MGLIITMVVFYILFSFGGQIIKGMKNIFSIFGRILGWVVGIGILVYIIKIFIVNY